MHSSLFRFIAVLNAAPNFWKMLNFRVPTCHIRDFSTFSARPSRKHCPSAQCACAANVVDKDLYVFAVGAVSLNHILQACTKRFK
jgi:hypothetical protein